MPIFAYRCEACGHSFDALQKLGAAALTDCTECGAGRLVKQLSAPAFHLKGKGWRKSDDRPKKPDVRPRYVHTLDSAVAHAEHHGHDDVARQAQDKRQEHTVHAGHSHTHVGDHDHSHHSHSHSDEHVHKPRDAKPKGGLGKLVKAHVESAKKAHSHDHSSGHSHGPGGHTHGPGGHTHAPKVGLKTAKKNQHD
jgi:putative FmdB family regulatory protein